MSIVVVARSGGVVWWEWMGLFVLGLFVLDRRVGGKRDRSGEVSLEMKGERSTVLGKKCGGVNSKNLKSVGAWKSKVNKYGKVRA